MEVDKSLKQPVSVSPNWLSIHKTRNTEQGDIHCFALVNPFLKAAMKSKGYDKETVWKDLIEMHDMLKEFGRGEGSIWIESPDPIRAAMTGESFSPFEIYQAGFDKEEGKWYVTDGYKRIYEHDDYIMDGQWMSNVMSWVLF